MTPWARSNTTASGRFVLHGVLRLPFFLAMAGLGTAWYIYMKNPAIADLVKAKAQPLYTILDRKYWMDELFQICVRAAAVAASASCCGRAATSG